MNKFQKIVTWLLEKTCKKVIIKDRNEYDIYMIRYILLKSKLFSIYIHRFLRSDLDIHHDHPWNFLTFILSKGYTEEVLVQEPTLGSLVPVINKRKLFSLAYRKAETIHRVILDKDYTEEEQYEAPLTVCFMFKRKRVWGFIQTFIGSYAWTNWKDFLGIKPEDPRYFGSE